MAIYTNRETINDWLNYIDHDIISSKESELSFSTKILVLDSIEVLDFIRKATDDDDIPIHQDQRLQKLIDLCKLPCKQDYYNRFLRYESRFYSNKNNWWNDCWQSIRLNNILHEMSIRQVDSYLMTPSDGKYFAAKWPKFFNQAKTDKEGSSSLPAFSYLECIRFLTNLGKEPPIKELDDFLYKLCEKSGDNLKLFEMSTEIRANALNTIDLINRKWPKTYDFNEIYSKLLVTLKEMILKSVLNEYSHSWAPILIKISDMEVIRIIESKIPTSGEIDNDWISGYKFIRKPRFALLSIIHKLNEIDDYFEIIEPNRFVYTPLGYINNYQEVARIIDNTIYSFGSMRDLQQKVQDNHIREDYFRDLLRSVLMSHIGETITWAEKEREVSSGRRTDILITVKKGPDIPVEIKLLWNNFNEGYNPITEVLEQTINGNLAVTFIINPKNNPLY